MSIRQGELVGRQVMAYETTEEVGTVEHLLVDVKRSQVVGLACKVPGLIARRQNLSWDQLVNAGRIAAGLTSETRLVVLSEVSAAAESQMASAQAVTGLEVWTDGGDHIGQLIDVCFDSETGQVQTYLFALHRHEIEPETEPEIEPETEPEFADSRAEIKTVTAYKISPDSIISAGRKRMMIAEEDAQRARPYDQPLSLNEAQLIESRRNDWIPEQLPEVPADFGELLQKGQSFAGKMTERVRQRARQFTDERLANQDLGEPEPLPDITEQLQAKADKAKQQMQQRFYQAKDQLDQGIEDRLGHTPLGKSLGKSLNRFKRPQDTDKPDSIDVEAFEVWEDDD
ncbi:MAG: PRC-barrel domain-containing protein [Phormidesmis sp.]